MPQTVTVNSIRNKIVSANVVGTCSNSGAAAIPSGIYSTVLGEKIFDSSESSVFLIAVILIFVRMGTVLVLHSSYLHTTTHTYPAELQQCLLVSQLLEILRL